LFAWIEQERELSPAALTVRAQAVSPNDTGRLLWDAFFPRVNADSIRLRTISDIDFRPVADRREWNGRGRLIPLRTPNVEELEMVPIESYFSLAEREIQELEERTLGNQDLFRRIVGTSIPTRVEGLAAANYRRIEVDAFTAWSLGQITAKNPQGVGAAATFDFGFAAERYQTAATAWNDPGLNAFDEFLAWLEDAYELTGGGQGVMLRQATLNAIKADAPQPVGALPMTTRQLAERVQDELGSSFQFYVNEGTVDVFNDGGTAVTRTKLWAAGRIAVVPQGERVGSTHFAPVARAFEVARRAGEQAGIDVRGMTTYHEISNGGRTLTIECQGNAMPIPEERLTAVMNTGIV
jgi:hypothetical protein